MTDTISGKDGLKGQLRTLIVLFAAMTAGVFVFACVCILLNQAKGPLVPIPSKYDDLVLYILAGSSIAGLMTGKYLYAKGLKIAVNQDISLPERLNQYTGALIKFLACCEAPAILANILFMMTGRYIFLIFTAILLLTMLSKLPLKARVIKDLQLSWNDQEQLV